VDSIDSAYVNSLVQFLAVRVTPILTDKFKDILFQKLVSIQDLSQKGISNTAILFYTRFPLSSLSDTLKRSLITPVPSCIECCAKYLFTPDVAVTKLDV